VSVALVTQHATRMRRIVICARLVLPYFSTLCHKRRDLRKEVFGHKICVLIFYPILSETFLILRRTERDMIINALVSSCKVLFILVIF
jgi:hypothetical protein